LAAVEEESASAVSFRADPGAKTTAGEFGEPAKIAAGRWRTGQDSEDRFRNGHTQLRADAEADVFGGTLFDDQMQCPIELKLGDDALRYC